MRMIPYKKRIQEHKMGLRLAQKRSFLLQKSECPTQTYLSLSLIRHTAPSIASPCPTACLRRINEPVCSL
jgi:hypothetical protein